MSILTIMMLMIIKLIIIVIILMLAVHCSMEATFVNQGKFLKALASERLDRIFPTTCTLLPADILNVLSLKSFEPRLN